MRYDYDMSAGGDARAVEDEMSSITIRDIDDGLGRRLHAIAAKNGRSVEEEARAILRLAVEEAAPPDSPPGSLYEAIRSHFRGFGDVELEIPRREPMREPPNFDSA